MHQVLHIVQLPNEECDMQYRALGAHGYADMCGEGSVSLLMLQLVKDAFLGHGVLLQSTAILGRCHGDQWNIKLTSSKICRKAYWTTCDSYTFLYLYSSHSISHHLYICNTHISHIPILASFPGSLPLRIFVCVQ